MAEKNNATCAICGKGYHMCISCRDEMQSKPWKTHCDSVDCFKVFQIIRGYNTGVYTKREAKSKLKMVDLSGLDEFKDNIKVIVEDIMGRTTKWEPVKATPRDVAEPEPVAEMEPSVNVESLDVSGDSALEEDGINLCE